ncbi:tumor protein D52-like isoform X5 [Ptychodera flava]|uniref:tumor protein D52-like isoform X5 n=1 Tax=Ptychodera flava TaxID=63121 RepID=UPI00396A21B3
MREKRSQDSGFSWSDVVSLSSLSTDDGEVNCVELSDEYDEYNTDMDLELTTTLTSSESYLEYLHLIQNSAETETKKEEPLYDSPTESQPLYDSLSSPSAGGGDETLYTNPDLVNDDEEKEALKTELEKTEEEITTLKQVLQAKEKRVHEIKQKLGLTPLNQFQKNVKESWTSIQQSSAYNKTKTGLSTASQKTGAAFTSFGSSVSRKMGELKNSTAFKSFEEKTTSFASSVKQAVVGSPKEETSNNSSFEEALNSTAQQQHQQQDEADLASPGSNNKLPEEKLPL